MYQKKKKRVWLWLVLLLVGTIVGGGYTYYRKEQLLESAETSDEEEITLGENQRLCYAYIDKILGNEMSVTVLEENGQETQETDTWMIPVGTDVVTKLGTTTTFARLSGGDTIKMLIQKMGDGSEEILKIWITDRNDDKDGGMKGMMPDNMKDGMPGNMHGATPEKGNDGFSGGE